LSCQPQPDNPQPAQSSTPTHVAPVVPIRLTGAPVAVMLALNCA
jgi:hypothetical protein